MKKLFLIILLVVLSLQEDNTESTIEETTISENIQDNPDTITTDSTQNQPDSTEHYNKTFDDFLKNDSFFFDDEEDDKGNYLLKGIIPLLALLF